MTPVRLGVAFLAGSLSLVLLAPARAAEPPADKILAESWQAYKAQFIQPDGRVIDWQNSKISTSEGQAYAMLRAVWMDDRPTFDVVLKWAIDNLQTRGDQLFSWKWGYDAQTSRWVVQDRASASDADQDIAVALILAHRRWGAANYLQMARALCIDIWRREVVMVGDHPVVVAADWAASRPQPPVNPSYLAPYAYRLFAKIDPGHNWIGALDSAYQILFESLKLSSVGLPPDWCAVSRESGELLPAPLNGDVSSDYSYDAWRILWRVALDEAWFNDPRAVKFIKTVKFPLEFWKKNKHLSEAITKDGRVRSDTETIAMLGAHLPAFALVDKSVAKQIFNDRLMTSYNRLGARGVWGNPKDYYSQNWAWFGIALYLGKLRLFSEDTPKPLTRIGLIQQAPPRPVKRPVMQSPSVGRSRPRQPGT